MGRRTLVLGVVVAVMGLLTLVACEGPAGQAGETGPQGDAGATGVPGATGAAGATGVPGAKGEQGIPGEPGEGKGGEYGSHLSTDAYLIGMEPVGHWHVGATKTLIFTVTDTATGGAATVKDLTVQIAQAGSTRVTSRTVEAGQVVYQGDGTYTLDYKASNFAPIAISARFKDGGQVFASPSWVAEIAKAGEEGIRADAMGTSYVYQIRYYWNPGHPHSSDTDLVTMSFEIMRGVQEGDDINWEQPWRNTLNHIVDADHAEIIIASVDGTVSEEVHPTYAGKGVYNAERVFTGEEVGHDGNDYLVTFKFTDPYNGAEIQNAEGFPLRISAPH